MKIELKTNLANYISEVCRFFLRCFGDLIRVLRIIENDQTVAHLAWKKGVCHGRAAFDVTF